MRSSFLERISEYFRSLIIFDHRIPWSRHTSHIICIISHMGMGQNLLVSILMGWTSIYQLLLMFTRGTRVMTHSHIILIMIKPKRSLFTQKDWAVWLRFLFPPDPTAKAAEFGWLEPCLEGWHASNGPARSYLLGAWRFFRWGHGKWVRNHWL